MNVNILMDKLVRAFPGSFSDDNLAIWEAAYRHALSGHEGAVLRRAYESCMDGWGNSWAPRPADILKHASRAHSSSGENMKHVAEDYSRFKPAVIAEWFRVNDENVQLFQRSFENEHDAGYARTHIKWEVEKRAHDVAMQRARGGQAQIEWTIGDWDICRRRVISQRRHAEGGQGYRYSAGVRALLQETAKQMNDEEKTLRSAPDEENS